METNLSEIKSEGKGNIDVPRKAEGKLKKIARIAGLSLAIGIMVALFAIIIYSMTVNLISYVNFYTKEGCSLCDYYRPVFQSMKKELTMSKYGKLYILNEIVVKSDDDLPKNMQVTSFPSFTKHNPNYIPNNKFLSSPFESDVDRVHSPNDDTDTLASILDRLYIVAK